MGGKFKFSAQYSELGAYCGFELLDINRKKILVVPDIFFFISYTQDN